MKIQIIVLITIIAVIFSIIIIIVVVIMRHFQVCSVWSVIRSMSSAQWLWLIDRWLTGGSVWSWEEAGRSVWLDAPVQVCV